MKRRRAATRGVDYKKLAGIRINVRRSKEETGDTGKAKQGTRKDEEKTTKVVEID